MISEAFGLMCQVIRIHSYAMPSYQAGFKRKKIPLGSRCLEDFMRIDSDAIEDERQLIYKRNVNVALRVLNNLSGLRYFYRRSPMGAGRYNSTVQLIDLFSHGRRASAGD